MFLLPSLLLGVGLALVLGGRPSRLLELDLRFGWAVWLSVAAQTVAFTSLGDGLPPELEPTLHLASYALLFLFALANARVVALLPLVAGMAANAVAIAANGGRMPVSPEAWAAAGLQDSADTNVRLGAERLGFLGDIFALPPGLPLANVFSVGDILIGLGVIVLIVTVSLGEQGRHSLVPARLARPLAVPSFRRLVAGKLVSTLGDWITVAALIGWIYTETESVGHVAVLMLVRLAPPVLGGGLAAALVDRLPKTRLLVGVELARGAAVAGAAAGVYLELRPLAFGAVAVSGLLAAVSAATVPSLVPSMLDDEQLPAGNAGLGIAQDVAMAVGALAAGIALSASSVLFALAVDFATFIVAAALYLGIRVRKVERPAEETEPADVGLRSGLRYLFKRRLLLVVVGAFGTATLATGLTNATLPKLLDDQLGLGAGSYGFGLSALAWGLVAGQALVGVTKIGPTGGRWFAIGLAAMAGLFVLLAHTVHAPTAILVLAFIGLVDGTTEVLFDTIVQREADSRYYGRIFGFASAFFTATMMGAVAAAPLVNAIAPPQEVILAAGVALALASSIALFGARPRETDSEAHAAPPEPDRVELAPILTLLPSPAEQVEAPSSAIYRVAVRLSDGERLPVAEETDEASARARALEVVRYLRSLGPGEWPLLGSRHLRPDAIISVDIVAQASTPALLSEQAGEASAAAPTAG